MRWWPWRRRDDSGAQQRDEAKRQLRAAKKMTERIERYVEDIVLPPDEFAQRVARAFQPPRGHSGWSS